MSDIKVYCSVVADDEWIQCEGLEGCHWEIKKYFEFTWKVPTTTDTKFFYFRIGTTGEYELVSASKAQCRELSNGISCWTYRKYLSELSDAALNKLYEEGKVTARISAVVSGVGYEDTHTIDYNLELAPKFEEDKEDEIVVKKYSSKKIGCTWPEGVELLEVSPLSGYSIELRHRPKDSDTWTTIRNLKAEKISNTWWLTKVEEEYEAPEFSDPSSIDLSTDVVTFIGSANSEGYIFGPEDTEVFFNPEDFGINKNDSFKVVISPFTVIGNYTEADDPVPKPGSLLAGEPIESEEIKFTLGIMRVKTAGGWKEGQVWVKTGDVWKEAISIKTKSSDTWKESI